MIQMKTRFTHWSIKTLFLEVWTGDVLCRMENASVRLCLLIGGSQVCFSQGGCAVSPGVEAGMQSMAAVAGRTWRICGDKPQPWPRHPHQGSKVRGSLGRTSHVYWSRQATSPGQGHKSCGTAITKGFIWAQHKRPTGKGMMAMNHSRKLWENCCWLIALLVA